MGNYTKSDTPASKFITRSADWSVFSDYINMNDKSTLGYAVGDSIALK